MKISRTILVPAGLVAIFVGLVLAMIFLGPSRSNEQAATGDWTCSMHPQIRKPGPGKCPICGMVLTPVSLAAK